MRRFLVSPKFRVNNMGEYKFMPDLFIHLYDIFRQKRGIKYAYKKAPFSEKKICLQKKKKTKQHCKTSTLATDLKCELLITN